MAKKYGIADIAGNHEGYNQEQDTDIVDGIQRAHREGCDAVEGEVHHLMNCVFRLAGVALADNIIDSGVFQANHRN